MFFPDLNRKVINPEKFRIDILIHGIVNRVSVVAGSSLINVQGVTAIDTKF
jgi:hypothetical protein